MINLPSNGALMTPEQFGELIDEVEKSGTPQEKAMLFQMKALVHGFTAMRMARETEWKCRLFAESQAHALAHRVKMAQLALSAPLSKLNKDGLKGVIEMARQELDGVESDGFAHPGIEK